jgi:hypothetical protein
MAIVIEPPEWLDPPAALVVVPPVAAVFGAPSLSGLSG